VTTLTVTPSLICRTPQLRVGEVHVWQTSVTQTASTFELLSSLLDPTEHNRAASFRFERDRNRYVVAHGTLRHVLGSYLDSDPQSIRFVNSRDGRPHLKGVFRRTTLSFNLSHDDEQVLIGLARFSPVGIDVQSHAVPIGTDLVVEAALSSRERAWVTKLETDPRPAVMQLWARKEALAKATGAGIATGLDRIDVSGVSPISITAPGPHLDVRLLVQDLDTGPGYAAAVATSWWCRRIERLSWDPRS